MKISRSVAAALALAALPALTGCVGLAEFRKLQYEVRQMKAGGGGPPRLADVSSEMGELREQVSQLEGRLEVTEHQVQGLEVRRRPVSRPSRGCERRRMATSGDRRQGSPPECRLRQVMTYRAAYNAWRGDDHMLCIDRFGQFLQSFPTSQYADDASFWLADCYFKQGDFKTAILRFDDVATRYPKSERASEALYRQGEALLKLGPNFGKAAEKAFDRVVKEYPDSRRAEDARQQLRLLGAG